jgi:acyl carrier protein
MKVENSNRLKEIFIEIFSVSESEVEDLRKINNRKWDSLASVMLVAAIESEFNILIQESRFEDLTSFAAVKLVLEEMNL